MELGNDSGPLCHIAESHRHNGAFGVPTISRGYPILPYSIHVQYAASCLVEMHKFVVRRETKEEPLEIYASNQTDIQQFHRQVNYFVMKPR